MRYSSTYVSERRLVMVRVSDLWIGLSFSARADPRHLRAAGSACRKCVARTAGCFGASCGD
jgi:hypothetical protein